MWLQGYYKVVINQQGYNNLVQPCVLYGKVYTMCGVLFYPSNGM